MSEWLFEAAGAGGTASPPQFWDLDARTLHVGQRRVPISSDHPDFELLRPARDGGGRHFPGAFSYSPFDGSALAAAGPSLSVTVGGDRIPRVAAPHGEFTSAPQLRPVPGNEAVVAGEPVLGFAADLSKGEMFRWSAARRQWLALVGLPHSSATSSMRKSVATPQGFVYALADRAAAVIFPGSESWREIALSPEYIVPATPAVAALQGAALLAWTQSGLCVLRWSQDARWEKIALTGDIPQGRLEFGAVVAAQGGIVGTCGEHAFQVTPDFRFVRREWPAGFMPKAGFQPFPALAGLFFLGTVEHGAPSWAFVAQGRGVMESSRATIPATPFGEGFVTESGWSAMPTAGTGDGIALPAGFVGKPLVQFSDATLFLAVEAGALWPDALAMARRRWRTRLIICGADGAMREITEEQRLDRLAGVEAVVLPDAIAILGLRSGDGLFLDWAAAAPTTTDGATG